MVHVGFPISHFLIGVTLQNMFGGIRSTNYIKYWSEGVTSQKRFQKHFWKQLHTRLIHTLSPDHAPDKIHNGVELYFM